MDRSFAYLKKGIKGALRAGDLQGPRSLEQINTHINKHPRTLESFDVVELVPVSFEEVSVTVYSKKVV